MPPIEGTLASYLSAGVTSTLKAPVLPSKKTKKTPRLNGRAYVAADQADLLNDLDQGQDQVNSPVHLTVNSVIWYRV